MTPSHLTPLQVQATRLFFSLPESAGFVLAGGAALIIRNLIDRPTRDIDLFLIDSGLSAVRSAADALERAVAEEGWAHHRVLDQQEFVRFVVTSGEESLLIDLGRDSPAEEPVTDTALGPALGPRDLATRKTLALFGRAEPRDFADVYELAAAYGHDSLARDEPKRPRDGHVTLGRP